jgi:hypothetical protein
MRISDKSSKRVTTNAAERTDNDASLLKYPKPKVLLVDLPISASQALIEKGFNVSVGSFGKPYKVQKSSSYQPLIGSGKLPNYTEQEIVVIDLHYDDLASGPGEERHHPEGEQDIWAKCDQGFIDPRPRTAWQVFETFDRAHSMGGIFVVFADAKVSIEMQLARMAYSHFRPEFRFDRDVWHFISELSDMGVTADHGFEMRKGKDDSALTRLVSEHLEGGQFFCTLQGGYRSDNKWCPIAENKFGQLVGLSRCSGGKGSVIVLPQLADKPGFLVKLFTNILPEIAPHLFPDIQSGKWTHRPEYELVRVLELKAKQLEVEQRAKNEIAELETELANERAINGWIHELLTGTGDHLVASCEKKLGRTRIQKSDRCRCRARPGRNDPSRGLAN